MLQQRLDLCCIDAKAQMHATTNQIAKSNVCSRCHSVEITEIDNSKSKTCQQNETGWKENYQQFYELKNYQLLTSEHWQNAADSYQNLCVL